MPATAQSREWVRSAPWSVELAPGSGWPYAAIGVVFGVCSAVLLVHEAGGIVLTRSGPVEGFPPVGEPFLVAHPGAADELHAVWTAALAAGVAAGAAAG